MAVAGWCRSRPSKGRSRSFHAVAAVLPPTRIAGAIVPLHRRWVGIWLRDPSWFPPSQRCQPTMDKDAIRRVFCAANAVATVRMRNALPQDVGESKALRTCRKARRNLAAKLLRFRCVQ